MYKRRDLDYNNDKQDIQNLKINTRPGKHEGHHKQIWSTLGFGLIKITRLLDTHFRRKPTDICPVASVKLASKVLVTRLNEILLRKDEHNK